MKKFKRKNPVILKAIQWDGENETLTEIENIPGIFSVKIFYGNLNVTTKEGNMSIPIFDWITFNSHGEADMCSDDDIKADYEEIK